MKVYLSGGFVTGWQEEVMDAVPDADYYNPETFEMPGWAAGAMPVEIYGPMDEAQIRACDVVFAYMENSNPTPINVALEVGFAKGLGKTIVLCNEWTRENLRAKNLRADEFRDGDGKPWFKAHYMDLINSWSDFCEPDFGRAIQILKALVDGTN